MANKQHLAKLKEGKEAWNQWRTDNPTVKPNLKGATLREKNLEGFDFSHTDIRGTNFEETYLKGANFTKATAGLQNRWKIFLVILACLFCGISVSCFFLIFSLLMAHTDELSTLFSFVVPWTVFIILFIYFLRQGLVVGAIAGFGFVAVGFIGPFVFPGLLSLLGYADTDLFSFTFTMTIIVAVALANILAIIIAYYIIFILPFLLPLLLALLFLSLFLLLMLSLELELLLKPSP